MGKLKVSKSHGKIQYYNRLDSGKAYGKYINKNTALLKTIKSHSFITIMILFILVEHNELIKI